MTKISFKPTLRQRLKAANARLLDLLASPVINRLNHEEYFSCKTRTDCLRVYAKRVIANRSFAFPLPR